MSNEPIDKAAFIISLTAIRDLFAEQPERYNGTQSYVRAKPADSGCIAAWMAKDFGCEFYDMLPRIEDIEQRQWIDRVFGLSASKRRCSADWAIGCIDGYLTAYHIAKPI